MQKLILCFQFVFLIPLQICFGQVITNQQKEAIRELVSEWNNPAEPSLSIVISYQN